MQSISVPSYGCAHSEMAYGLDVSLHLDELESFLKINHEGTRLEIGVKLLLVHDHGLVTEEKSTVLET